MLYFVMALLGCMLVALAGPVLVIKGTQILLQQYNKGIKTFYSSLRP